MVQEKRFIYNLLKSELILMMSIVFIVSILFCDLTNAADTKALQIIGSWQVYRDDDRPNGSVPKETMDFWGNGKFLISGDHPNKGLYRINGNQLEFLIKKGNRAITAERRFELSAKELKFKNDKIGWVYYKRLSEQPEGEEPGLN